MALAVRGGGADSAIALYRSLRTRYYGSGAYDFSELQLNEAGSQIAANAEHRAAAIAILRLNLEFFPQSIPTMQNLANISIQAGDTATAVETLTKALEIQPNNNQLRNLLQRIKPPGE
jgi:tetratricopeptide (TPR) repeat protein